MHRRRRVGMGLLGAALVCCAIAAGRAAGTPAREPGERAALLALVQRQAAAWNRGDLDGFMAEYWNSPELVFQSGGSTTRGWQPTLERFRRRYQGEGRAMGRLEFVDFEAQLLGPDAGLLRGGWRLHQPDGSSPHGLVTLVVRRLSGSWKIVHDHTSSAE